MDKDVVYTLDEMFVSHKEHNFTICDMGWTLRVIMLSEVSQVKTFKYGMMSLMCVESRNKQMNQMEETHR